MALAEPSLQYSAPLKHPIVLVHGATLHGSQLQVGPFPLGDYFNGVASLLSATHTPVYTVEMPTDGSIGERAALLKNYLETDLRGQNVNVIAHSLGGLDARYAISILKCTQISSLTTIGTPHRGTPLADWAMNQVKSQGLWYWFFRLFGYDMAMRHFLPEITTLSMQRFNEKVPDAIGVKYFSIRSKADFSWRTMSAFLWFPAYWLEGQHNILSANGHDGMVPYDSQSWGQELGSMELDHLGQMNHHELRLLNVRAESRELYVNLYKALEKEGL